MEIEEPKVIAIERLQTICMDFDRKSSIEYQVFEIIYLNWTIWVIHWPKISSPEHILWGAEVAAIKHNLLQMYVDNFGMSPKLLKKSKGCT